MAERTGRIRDVWETLTRAREAVYKVFEIQPMDDEDLCAFYNILADIEELRERITDKAEGRR